MNGVIHKGFTLIEILVVMAIMAVLTTLLIPAFANIGKSGALNSGGALVVGLANAARQNSLSRNAMTALVVVSDPSIDSQNRVFTILEMRPFSNGSALASPGWKQISKWETLAPGVVVVDGTSNPMSSTTPTPAFPTTLHYGGKTISQFKSLIFMPNGTTYSTSPTTIELVEGYYPTNSTTPVLTDRSISGGTAANYYKLTVLNATGRIKIDRP